MASVTYKIGGKYDGKAVKTAKQDIKSLGDTVKNITGVIKGLAVVKVIQELNKVANATKGVYLEQNKALSSFNTAVKNSNIEISKLNNLKKELSNGNFIDDDTINNAIKYGIQMGLTGDKLEKVTKTAINMNASGVMPLDRALKQLTTTALKNGDELDKVAARYDGFASAMANTFSGRNTQWENSVSDLKAAIGSIPVALEFLTQGKLLEPLNKITEWITENRNYIINFFLHLPEVFSTVVSSIKDIINKFVNGIQLNGIDVYFLDYFSDTANGIFDVFEALGQQLKTLFSLIAQSAGKVFGSNFLATIQALVDSAFDMVQGMALPNVIQNKLTEWRASIYDFFNDKIESGDDEYAANIKELKKELKENTASVGKATSILVNTVKKDLSAFVEHLDLNADVTTLKSELETILSQDLPQDLINALNGITGTYTDNTETSESDNSSSEVKTPIKDAIINSTGEIGNLIKTFFDKDGGWKAVIGVIIEKMADVITSASDIITNALNGITYFFNQVLPPVIKVLENWLSPVLVFIQQIGAIFRDFFNLLEPFFSELGSSVIKTVLIIIITVLDAIYDAVVAIHNIFASNKNDWSYRDIGNDISAIGDAQSTFSATAALTTSNASVSSSTAARDIYVNIIYNHSYVNGDADVIALDIRDRIREAEQMGY